MKRKIQRALWGICVMCAVILAYGNTVNTAEPSPLELLSKLRALKTSSVSSTVHDGWLDEKIITLSAVSTPITVMRGTPETEEKIAQDIKGARYIYMTCQFLANPKIIQALCYAKRVNSATIVCVLENKINAQNYITPDYLTQNGIFVFNPSESQKISGAAMLLDNAKVYLFSDLDLSQCHELGYVECCQFYYTIYNNNYQFFPDYDTKLPLKSLKVYKYHTIDAPYIIALESFYGNVLEYVD